MDFVCIPEKTAKFALHSIWWLLFKNLHGKCLLCGTNCVFKYNGLHFVLKGLIQPITSHSLTIK